MNTITKLRRKLTPVLGPTDTELKEQALDEFTEELSKKIDPESDGEATHVSDESQKVIEITPPENTIPSCREYVYAPITSIEGYGFRDSAIQGRPEYSVISVKIAVELPDGEREMTIGYAKPGEVRRLAHYVGEYNIREFVGYRIPIQYSPEHDDAPLIYRQEYRR